MREFKLILIFFVFLFVQYSANSFVLSTYNPVNSQQAGYNSYPRVTNLEKIILKKTYEYETLESRLARLEKKTCSQIFPSADLSWRVENITSKVDQTALYNIPSKELASIEKQVLGRSFTKENLDKRFARLEMQMFGAVQSGQFDERFQTILTGAQHYNNFNQDIVLADSSTGRGRGLKGFLSDTFGSIFSSSGYVTGYTPSVAPYGYSAPYGFNNHFNHGFSNPFNNSWGSNFNNSFINNYGTGFNSGMHSPYCRSCPAHRYNPNTGHQARYYNFKNSSHTGCGVNILD